MVRYLKYSTCRCGGTLVHEWKANEFIQFDYCLKCGEYDERFPDEYPELPLKSDMKFFIVSEGGGRGSARFVSEDGLNHDVYLLSCGDDIVELKEMVEDAVENGEYRLDLEKSFIYLYDEQFQQGEVIFGLSHPDQYDNLYGENHPQQFSDVSDAYVEDEVKVVVFKK